MLVMANCSLARSRVDIALLVGVGGGAPDTARQQTRAHDISPRKRRHHPEGVTLFGPFLPAGPVRTVDVTPRGVATAAVGGEGRMRGKHAAGAGRAPGLDALPGPRATAPLPSAVRLPADRPGTIRRARLLARLDRAPPGQLIVLVAPGGYGKTTLLGQWVARAAAVCAWLVLDQNDDDPSSLAPHIALALQVALPLDAEALGLSERVLARRRLDPADLVRAIAAMR